MGEPETGAITENRELCSICGLCCDGSLFGVVTLEGDEPARFETVENGQMALPCKHHCDGACTVYETRPAACDRFNCNVLNAVKSGARDMDWARERVTEIREVLQDLEESIPGDEPSIHFRTAQFIEENQHQKDHPVFRAHNHKAVNSIEKFAELIRDFRTLD